MAAPAPLGFKRSSVVDQAAAALRAAIRTGELREPLPGGHQLARQLGISRPSVQAALARLQQEGMVVVRQGQRPRLAHKSTRPSPPAPPRVCVICPLSSEAMSYLEHPLLLEMHAEFASRGIGWEVVSERNLDTARPEARLRALVAARPHVCWIVFSAPERVQAWFAQARVPTVVLGTCASGLRLPAVDVNYAAVGWHAAGMISRHGHRRIALLLPAKTRPGDRASIEAFERYIAQQRPLATLVQCPLPDHPGQRRAKLSRLLQGRDRPTVLVSLRPTLTIAAVAQVLAAGLRIPEDISIFARDNHPLIDGALPELTRYRSSAREQALRAVRIAARLLAGRAAPTRPSLVTPTFVPGATLAKWSVPPPSDGERAGAKRRTSA
jgi:DNA-binding LacI/PurR family transcriptional regulator